MLTVISVSYLYVNTFTFVLKAMAPGVSTLSTTFTSQSSEVYRTICYCLVPPSIIDNMTSTDMVVREGSDVSLVCRASGYPEPYVMWRREDGQDFNYNGESGKQHRRWKNKRLTPL